MRCFIVDADYYLPVGLRDNEFLRSSCGADETFLEKKIGIQRRHIAASEEYSSHMAVAAGKKLLERHPYGSDHIRSLMLCTQNPDYRIPTTACLVHQALDLSQKCLALDINLGCSGFTGTLALAERFLLREEAGSQVLVVTSEQYSKVIDPSDKNTAAIFGDAAAAVLVGQCPEEFGVLDCEFGTDGSGAFDLVARNSAVACEPNASPFLQMNGRAIFEFALKRVPECVDALLGRNGIGPDDIDYFVFHQANAFMLNELRRKMGIPVSKFVVDMRDYGNTVSSTIPIALTNMLKRNELNHGTRVVLCGFGVGLSWSAVLYRHFSE